MPERSKRGPGWHAVAGMLEPDKKTPSFLYHLGFIVGLVEGGLASGFIER
jgi:hypothetical protein